MKVAVYGLWHLGCVTAACLAMKEHRVIGLDPDEKRITDLSLAHPPVAEPGLDDAIRAGLANGLLSFSANLRELADAEILWVTFDTPVDAQDRADTQSVIHRIQDALPYLRDGAIILISSQLPIGSVAALEHHAASIGKPMHFACSPENLRLGKAFEVFLNPDRIIVGVRNDHTRKQIAELLAPITDRIIWMSPESAEMSKHAINSFLALSVAYSNELAALCEATGADAKDVERALKSEKRIGPEAYLSPGPAFAGGTLARDVAFLNGMGSQHNVPIPLIASIQPSNDQHKLWIDRKIAAITGTRRNVRIAVWGLTYKPGTDTLRRSSSVELCRRLTELGHTVCAHDPSFSTCPPELKGLVQFSSSPAAACRDCEILVICTPWPIYRDAAPDDVACEMTKSPVIIDAARFLSQSFGQDSRFKYVTIGKP